MSYHFEVSIMHWVVMIMDPDYNDYSPYPVVAEDEGEAVAKAIASWRSSVGGEDFLEDSLWDEPEIGKIYRASWIGERVR
jgi:hypothetical protein